jgi:hypothetical protein
VIKNETLALYEAPATRLEKMGTNLKQDFQETLFKVDQPISRIVSLTEDFANSLSTLRQDVLAMFEQPAEDMRKVGADIRHEVMASVQRSEELVKSVSNIATNYSESLEDIKQELLKIFNQQREEGAKLNAEVKQVAKGFASQSDQIKAQIVTALGQQEEKLTELEHGLAEVRQQQMNHQNQLRDQLALSHEMHSQQMKTIKLLIIVAILMTILAVGLHFL